MSTPYQDLLHVIVDRLKETDLLKDPPAVLVVPEQDEPSDDRPGQGDLIDNVIASELESAGLAVVVYIDSVELTNQRADRVEVHVQVIENVANNRSQSGTRKPCWTVLHAIRSSLDGYQATGHEAWSAFRFVGFDSIDKSVQLIREAKFTTTGFIR